jgi:hypothetical protein
VGTVRDTIEIARHQVPACAVITDAFWAQSELVARSVGMPDVPRVRVPYPLAGTPHDTIAAAARDAVDQVARALGFGR